MLFRNKKNAVSPNSEITYLSIPKTDSPGSPDNLRKKTIEYAEAGDCFRKSIPLSAFFKARGSLTIEASLVLPLFIIFFIALYTFFAAMTFEIRLKSAMNKSGKNIAMCYYAVSELKDETKSRTLLRSSLGDSLLLLGISETYVRRMVETELGAGFIGNNLIKNGLSGISYLGSRFDSENEDIILCASCELNIPLLTLVGVRFRISGQSVHRVWTGKKIEGETKEQVVYITENGTVYHTSLACTHLKLSIKEVAYDSIDMRTNEAGKKYRECSICGELFGSRVFITNYGECYHYNLHCSGLKRGIKSVSVSKTSLPKCKRCLKREKG